MNCIQLTWVSFSTCIWKLEYSSAWRVGWCLPSLTWRRLLPGGGEIKSSISFVSIRSTYRQHSKKGTRGSQFWEPESLQSNKIWETMIHIKLVNLPFTTNEICERFGHCIEKFRKLSCCLTQISRVCVCLCPFSKYV